MNREALLQRSNELELEIERLKPVAREAEQEVERIKRSIRDSVRARSVDAPDEVKAILADMEPEQAFKHLDTILAAGGARATAPSQAPLTAKDRRLSQDERHVAFHMGMTHDEYALARQAVRDMNARMREAESFRMRE